MPGFTAGIMQEATIRVNFREGTPDRYFPGSMAPRSRAQPGYSKGNLSNAVCHIFYCSWTFAFGIMDEDNVSTSLSLEQ